MVLATELQAAAGTAKRAAELNQKQQRHSDANIAKFTRTISKIQQLAVALQKSSIVFHTFKILLAKLFRQILFNFREQEVFQTLNEYILITHGLS